MLEHAESIEDGRVVAPIAGGCAGVAGQFMCINEQAPERVLVPIDREG